jgi:hypothetical protein
MEDIAQDSPSLFDAPPPLSYEQAREFVRWCCSFGAAFRNSPDVTNLRYWAQKNAVRIKPADEREILETARPLFLKRIDQFVRKAEAAKADLPN